MSDLMQELLNVFGLTSEVLNNIDNLKEFIPVFIKLCLATGVIGIIFGFFFSFGNGWIRGRFIK